MANTASRLSANGSLTISGSFDEVTFNSNNSSISKNLFAYSQSFTKGLPFWNINSITTTISSDIAPDGTRTATLLTGTGLYPLICQFYLNYIGNGFNEDEIWTHSIYVKYINQQYCSLLTENFPGPPNLNVSVRFDLINGTFSGVGGAGISAGMARQENGWWRVYYTTRIPKGASQWQPQFRIGTYDGTNYAGSQMLIWGAQLEKNSVPTIYVPTGSPKNILLSTENNSNVYNWYNENIIISPRATIDPNGNYLGQLISSTINGSVNTCYTNQQITNLDTNTNYTYSIYLKQGTSPTTFFNFYNNSPFSEIGAIITWPTIEGNNPTISYYGGGTRLASTFTAVNNGWWRVSLSMNTGSSTAVTCRVYVTTNSTTNVIGNSVYIWGAQLEYGLIATQYISNGGIYSNVLPASNSISKLDSSNNVASLYIKGEFNEVDYNPNSRFKKNLINQSNFTSGWLTPAIYTTLTPNAAIAPDKKQTAALVSFITGGSQYVYQNMTWTMGNTYTMSCYVKPILATFFLVESFQQYGYVTFNLTGNGSVQSTFQSSVIITNSGITYDPNTGYYRCSVTFVATTTGSNNIGFANGGATNGDGFYLWGAQVELGPLSIYTPTGANAIIANTFNQRTTNTGNTYVRGSYDEVYTGSLNMVTNGLTLYMDAAKLDSYPETGTRWNDIGAGANFNATFTSTPNHVGGQYIAFDETYYANTGKTPAQLGMYNQPFTAMALFRVPDIALSNPGSTNDHMVLGTATTSPQQGMHFGTRHNNFWMGFYGTDWGGGVVVPNQWYLVTWVWNNTAPYYSIYVNGTLITSGGSNTPFLGTTNLLIGSSAVGTHKSDVNMVAVYNRALSQAEVTQNYNAFRGPFGI